MLFLAKKISLFLLVVTFLSACHIKVNSVEGGAVVSDDGRINCGHSCVAEYNYSKTVDLSARLQPGYRLDRWNGNCQNKQPADNCVVSVGNYSGNKIVTPVFQPLPAGQYSYVTQFSANSPENLSGQNHVDFGLSVESNMAIDGALTAGSIIWENVAIDFFQNDTKEVDATYRAKKLTLTIAGDGTLSAVTKGESCSGLLPNICESFIYMDVWNEFVLESTRIMGQDARGEIVHVIKANTPVLNSFSGYIHFSFQIEVHGIKVANTGKRQRFSRY